MPHDLQRYKSAILALPQHVYVAARQLRYWLHEDSKRGERDVM